MQTLPRELFRGYSRRDVLRWSALGGLTAWTAVAEALARAAEGPAPAARTATRRATSLILLWMNGGPSQLETFDPHVGAPIAHAETRAIATRQPGIQIAAGLERTADQFGHVALVRSVVSNEGDHERATYQVKTGYRPNPTVVHPSIGAVVCHQLPRGQTEIPRHVSLYPGRWPGQGGYLGSQYDPFRTFDPRNKVPDVVSAVTDARLARRLEAEAIVDRSFARGREAAVEATRHRALMDEAHTMMASAQLRAFDLDEEPAEVQAAYGDSPFGRGCLVARRLVEVGVRCVEVNLNGWDSHIDNLELQTAGVATLDPALAALLADLARRDRLRDTLVVWGGEFGRTPKINPAGGRDHWPAGFSMLLAGGPLRRGITLGATDPEGKKLPDEAGVKIADLHATILAALGIDPAVEVLAPIGRPMKLSEGTPVRALLEDA